METLGSASVICSDKTGTLTRNEMTIQRVVTASGEVEVAGIGYRARGRGEPQAAEPVDGALSDEVRVVLGGGSLANDAGWSSDDGTWTVQGDPTEAAFLVAEREARERPSARGRDSRGCGEIPFTLGTQADDHARGRCRARRPDRADDQGGARTCCSPAARSERAADAVPLTDERRAEILSQSTASLTTRCGHSVSPTVNSTRRLRPLPTSPSSAISIFAGVVGIIDPPRPEARTAIAEANSAGVRVVMITGDHARTAARIAATWASPTLRADGAGPTLTGPELDILDDASLRAAVRSPCPSTPGSRRSTSSGSSRRCKRPATSSR